jgi:hypothetical protein
MSGTNYVKKDTFEKMKEELQHMKGIERPAMLLQRQEKKVT